MKSKCQSKDAKQVQQSTALPSARADESTLLAMLESLADSLESKADEVSDRDDDSSKVRGDTLRDVASAIRDRFLP